MPPFDFAGSPVAVREDIGGAHARAWERIAAPGSWWTGAERVAIAQEVRSAEGCALCRERRVALSPAAVQGEHEPPSVLPKTAVEAVHRLVTDTSRLSQAWYQGLLADGLSDAHYVEIVGVVTSTFSVDELHRGVGAPLEPLPEPRPGEPERRRPRGATMEGAWVPTVPPGGLDAADADLYAAYDGGHVGNVIRAMSLAPGEVRGLRDLSNAHYLPPGGMRSLPEPRALSRRQIELIASRVSVLNECFY